MSATGADGVEHHRVATGSVVAGVEVVVEVAVMPGDAAAAGGPSPGAPSEAGRAWRRPLLLLAGLGAQRIDWPEVFLQRLRAAGLTVIAMDNRDAGASTALPGPVTPVTELEAALAGDAVDAPYGLAQVAADAVAVLDHLDVPAAHVLGRSMGGMIAQHVAIARPDRVSSLTILSSTSGDPLAGQPTPAARDALIAPTPTDRAGVIESGVARARLTGSPGLFDEQEARRRIAARYDRAHRPEGTARQLLAILTDGDRSERLAGVSVPTLVLHGDADPLVTVSGGRSVAAAIPGARFEVLEGMGHDLPAAFLPRIVDALLDHARTAEQLGR